MRRCGAVVDMRPYYAAVEQGGDPERAWDSTAPALSGNMQLGLWKKDLMAAAAGLPLPAARSPVRPLRWASACHAPMSHLPFTLCRGCNHRVPLSAAAWLLGDIVRCCARVVVFESSA